MVRVIPCSLLVWLFCALAHAYDVKIESASVFQAYDMEAPGASVAMARRRFVQTLGMTYADRLSKEDPLHQGPQLVSVLNMRLDSELGDTCFVSSGLCYSATNSNDVNLYQPLARDGRVDVPTAYVEVLQLPMDSKLRVGRQLQTGPWQWVRMDGATGSLRIGQGPHIHLWGGRLVRQTTLGGSDAFEPQGTLRAHREGVDRVEMPWVLEPSEAWVWGVLMDAQVQSWLHTSIGFRDIRESAGVMAQRLGATVALFSNEKARLDGMLSVDPIDGTLVQTRVQGEADLNEAWTLRSAYERQVPRFDAGSIWAYFQTAPIAITRLGAAWEVNKDSQVGGYAQSRFAELEAHEDDHDWGTEAYAQTQIEHVRVLISGFGWTGSLGPLSGGLLEAWRPLGAQVRLQTRASLWYFEDAVDSNAYAASFACALGAVYQLSEQTQILLDVENYFNPLIGHGMRAVASLTMATWR